MAPGIFSPGGLDKGTAVLLDEAPAPPPTGTFLDLGCGWGPIALTLALRSPAATRLGARRQRAGARPHPPQRRRAGARRRARRRPPTASRMTCGSTSIWSNPPIRVGKAVLHALLRTWLPRLAPGGVAHLVVQQEPRLGQPAALDRDRARDAVHPARLEQGLPGARGEAAVTRPRPPRWAWCSSRPCRPRRCAPSPLAADRHLDELWLWEDCFKESARSPRPGRPWRGPSGCASASAWPRCRCATSPCWPWSSPPCTGSSPGRLLPGIGHGVQDWMGQVGARRPRP